MGKNVILVNSLFNVIMAVQIRRTLFAGDYFDIVLSDQSVGLDKLFLNEELKKDFNNVYYAKTEALRGGKGKLARITSLVNPKDALKLMIGEKLPDDYTDIFVWNPDPVFYYLYMTEVENDRKFKIHVYSDGASGYIMEEPREIGAKETNLYNYYKFKRTEEYLKSKYKIKPLSKMDFDCYLFSPELGINSGRHEYVEIPKIEINATTKEIFGNLFSGQLSGVEGKKYILFARPICDSMDNPTPYEDMLMAIADKVGRDNFVIKPHPRCNDVDYDIFKRCGISLTGGDMPWEIYCMNHDTKDIVYLTLFSAAVIMPYLLFGQKNKTIMLYDMLQINDIGMIQGFFNKFGDYLITPKTIEELLQNLED